MTIAQEIHAAAFQRVSTLKYFKTFKQTPMLKVTSSQLPRLSVYILRDKATAEGDANAGEPNFVHDMTLGFSGSILASDDDDALLALEDATGLVTTVLLTDPSFIKLTEGITSIDRKLVFSQLAESPIAEIQIEMTFQYREDWPPNVPDDLKIIHVESRYPPGANPNAVQQIDRQYDLTP